jgi:lipid II:glycine glycyltransferase (peptidoglycan interpeptide bridge formation enzyme)
MSTEFRGSIYNSEAEQVTQNRSYEEFVQSQGEYLRETLSEEAYYQSVKRAENAWRNIEALTESLMQIVELLIVSKPPEIFFYHPIHTLNDLSSALHNLTILSKNGATKARIGII